MTRAPQLPPWADAEASRILPDLCGRGEGQTIEFKERLPSQAHDIAKSIAAFASTNDGYLNWVLPSFWHVSSQVGGGGSRQLVSLYDLFRKWIDSEKSYLVLGRLIDDKLAQSVINGNAYPGIVARQPLSHWWDDLTNLDHQWTSREGSEHAYGSEFVAAQDILRAMIKRTNPPTPGTS